MRIEMCPKNANKINADDSEMICLKTKSTILVDFVLNIQATIVAKNKLSNQFIVPRVDSGSTTKWACGLVNLRKPFVAT